MIRYITISGIKYYFGTLPFEIKEKVILKKDRDNEYDQWAIAVYKEGFGKVGYVAANSASKIGGTYSALEIYPFFTDKCEAEIAFMKNDFIIAKIEDCKK